MADWIFSVYPMTMLPSILPSVFLNHSVIPCNSKGTFLLYPPFLIVVSDLFRVIIQARYGQLVVTCSQGNYPYWKISEIDLDLIA